MNNLFCYFLSEHNKNQMQITTEDEGIEILYKNKIKSKFIIFGIKMKNTYHLVLFQACSKSSCS